MKDIFSEADPEARELLDKLRPQFEGLRARHPDCPTPQMLLAARSEAAEEEFRTQIGAHLERCALCRSVLEALSADECVTPTRAEKERILQRVRERAASAGGKVPTRSAWAWLWNPAPALAMAAVVFLLVGGGYYLFKLRGSPNSSSVARVNTSPASAPSVLALEKPAAMIPPGALVVWRGKGNTPQPFWVALNAALEPYRSGDYGAAVAQLKDVASRFPNSAEPYFYLGVSQLFLKQTSDAAASLERAQQLASGPLADESAWYLALAYHAANNSARATEQLGKVCGGKSEYAAKACAAMKSVPTP